MLRADPEVADCEEGCQLVAAGGEGLAATFEAVDDGQYALDLQADFFAALDCKETGTPGCDDVLDDRDRFTGLKRTFDKFGRAVLLGFFADDDTAERRLLDAGQRENSGR